MSESISGKMCQLEEGCWFRERLQRRDQTMHRLHVDQSGDEDADESYFTTNQMDGGYCGYRLCGELTVISCC